MKVSRIAGGVFIGSMIVAALAIPAASAAAPVSDSEAGRLNTMLTHIIGDRPGVVTVKTDGDGYLATITLAPLIAQVSSGAFTATVTPLNIRFAPEDSGRWRVTEDQPFAMSATGGGVSYSVAAEHIRWKSVFDEASLAFLSSEMTISKLSNDHVMPVNGSNSSHVTQTIAEIASEYTVTPGDGGHAMTAVKTKITGFNQVTQGFAQLMAVGGQVTMTIDRISQEGEIRGETDFSLVKLILLMASYQSTTAPHPAVSELKPIVKAMMPIFERMEMTDKIEHLVFDTGLGRFGLAAVTTNLSLNGIVKDGFLRERITLNGPELPAGLVPAWGNPLLPTDVVLDVSVTGFDLATPAAMLIDTFDPIHQTPLSGDMLATLEKSLLPNHAVTIAIGPSHIGSKTTSIDAEGTVAVGPGAPPSAKASIKAHGLDDAIATLTAAPPNTIPEAALPMLFLVKGMAKTQSDGTLVWDISATPDGAILINGAPFQAK